MSMGKSRGVRGGRRADARMRRCLILRQGDKPPETPGPLSLGVDCKEGRTAVKGTLRRQNRPPLTAVLPSEDNIPIMRERRPTDRALHLPPAGRHQSVARSLAARALRAHEALPHAPPGGQAPLRPPKKRGVSLDKGRPSHGSRDREGAVPKYARPQPARAGRKHSGGVKLFWSSALSARAPGRQRYAR